ncbi:MAG: HD domain-containing protein [Desulfuromonadaceae bacterium]|nr:HD domain-containing protein [Desulfuromonadaceae bacterium]
MNKIFSYVRSAFGRRIFILFILCSLLPVSLLALVSLQRVSSQLKEDSHEHLRQAGKSVGMTVLEGLTLLQADLESAPITEVDGTKRQTAGHVSIPRFRAVRVRTYDAGTGVVSGFSRPLPPTAIAHLSDGNALLLADTDLGAGVPMYMATSVNRNLPQQCLLIGEINPEYLWTLVGYTLSRGIDICIVAPSGRTLYASHPFTPTLISNVMTQLKKSATGQFEWQQEDAGYLVSYWSAYLQPTLLTDSWTVVAIQSENDALGPAHSFITSFLLIIFLTLFVVVFASSFLIRRSLVPLAILKDGANRLSSGDFNSEVQITSGDEFEDLAISFNDMSGHLGNLIDELHWLNRGTIEVLANTVDAKSPWTAGHSQRVTRLALEIGKVMGLSTEELQSLYIAGMFHDIGKIGIPEAIIDKPGSLTEEEYAIVKKHPEIGAEILKPLRSYHAVLPIVWQHHEQFDGGGYPLGLAGEEIVLGARIMAVADVFDALYSSRPYRQGWELTTVIDFIEEHAGNMFDPEVVMAFHKVDLDLFLETNSETGRLELEQR